MASNNSGGKKNQNERDHFRSIATNAFHRQSSTFYEHPIADVPLNIKRQRITVTTTNEPKCKVFKRNDSEEEKNVMMNSHVPTTQPTDDNISIPSLFETDTLMITTDQPDHVIPLDLSIYSPTITVMNVNEFGLLSYSVKFKHHQVFNLLIMHLMSVWILLTDDLKFSSLSGNDNMIEFGYGYYMNLCYGALISMNKFLCYSETYFYQKKSVWKLLFKRDQFAFVIADHDRQTIHEIKKVITKEHIKPGVVINISENGFVVYVCIKGNPAEYVKTKGPNKRYCRVNNREVQPQFSGLRLAISTTNKLDKYLHIADTATRNVQQTFRKFISFFQFNKIPVYFSSIQFDRKESTANCQARFRTFLPNYSYQMLLTIGGCRLQEKMTHRVNQQLLALQNDNELFYHVCLRLIRYASKTYFLDIFNEIQNILKDYNEFYIHSLFRQSEKSSEMIPYVVVTPTMTKFYPFKRAKSNRIFRATDKFGEIKNFALVEFRDDNNSQLQTSDFCDLIQLIDNCLDKEHGLQIGGRFYQYFHHAQSQLKQKQLYFYYHDKQSGFLSIEDG